MHRRARHLNPGSAGATVALDTRFITGLNDGDLVSTWTGRAGTSNNATSSGTARPTYQVAEINGLPVLQFLGGDDQVTVGITVANPCTILSVQYATTDVFSYRVAFSAGNNALGLGYDNLNQIYLFSSTGFAVARSRPASLEVLSGTVNGASSVLTANGSIATGSVANFSTTNLRLFTNGSNGFYAGFGSRLEYYPMALAASLRKRLEHSSAYSFKIPCN